MCRTTDNIIEKYYDSEGKLRIKRYCTCCYKIFETPSNTQAICCKCNYTKYSKGKSQKGNDNIVYIFIPKNEQDIKIEYPPVLYVGETCSLYTRMSNHANYHSTATKKLRDEYNIENTEYNVISCNLGTDISANERKYLESWLINQILPVGNTQIAIKHKPKSIKRRKELQNYLKNAPLYLVLNHRLTDNIMDFNIADLIKQCENFNKEHKNRLEAI